MVEMDNRSAQLAREEDECRRNVSLATKQFNEALAAEKKARDNLNKQKELDDNFTELTNQVRKFTNVSFSRVNKSQNSITVALCYIFSFCKPCTL